MSLSTAEMYARRARDASDHSEVGDSTWRAIRELIKEIKRLESEVVRLRSSARA